MLKGKWCVFINVDGTIIYLLNLSNNQMKSVVLTKENLSFHHKLTCGQIHPGEECIAFGTASGRILLWYWSFPLIWQENWYFRVGIIILVVHWTKGKCHIYIGILYPCWACRFPWMDLIYYPVAMNVYLLNGFIRKVNQHFVRDYLDQLFI